MKGSRTRIRYIHVGDDWTRMHLCVGDGPETIREVRTRQFWKAVNSVRENYRSAFLEFFGLTSPVSRPRTLTEIAVARGFRRQRAFTMVKEASARVLAQLGGG
jgi:hypothetical protein